MSDKVECRNCNAMILLDTAEKNQGFCVHCKKTLDLEKAYKEKQSRKADKVRRRREKYRLHVFVGIRLFVLLIFIAGAVVNYIEGKTVFLILHFLVIAISVFELIYGVFRGKYAKNMNN